MKSLLLCAAVAAFAQAPASEHAPTSWRPDVQYLVSHVESIHPAPFWKNGRDVWAEEIRDLEETIDELEPQPGNPGLLSAPRAGG